MHSELVGRIKFWDPVEDSNTGDFQLTLGRNTYLLFNSDIVNFVWKTNEEEEKSVVSLIFVLWRCFYRRWIKGGGVVQKVLFRASWNGIFFQPEISMKILTVSGTVCILLTCFIDWIFLRFVFMSHCCFRLSCPGNL